MNDETDAWAASALSVREALRDAADSEVETGTTPDSETGTAVATVVAVEGSAYRRPGAKRVLGDEAVGAITAGCLEGPVADLAERALAEGALCETFDLTGEDESWGFGLGCNGVIDVLVEPADRSFLPALERVAAGERVSCSPSSAATTPTRRSVRGRWSARTGTRRTATLRARTPDSLSATPSPRSPTTCSRRSASGRGSSQWRGGRTPSASRPTAAPRRCSWTDSNPSRNCWSSVTARTCVRSRASLGTLAFG
ncbi:XdhC family protein [Halorussus caseinilyticus]|uniref:XdhC family protein n=1 Tax=Halorussus caseinilyticus TaxID=3034025 RepID=A0ABD5WID8_9EURY